MRRYSSLAVLLSVTVSLALAQEPLVRYDFAQATAAENGVTVQGAGFGAYPPAEVTFGALPVDNAFEGATDGTGLIVRADPGEGVMVFAAKVATAQAALVRISVRTDSPHAAITLATIGEEPDVFISTHSFRG